MDDSSASSFSSKDVSSAISLYNLSTHDGMKHESGSMRPGMELENEEIQGAGISRPLSRSSVTSSLSMVATKDGIEGRKVHRYGISPYSLNLLNSMAQSHLKKPATSRAVGEGLSGASDVIGSGALSDLSGGAPMSLRDKMRLLNDKSYLPQLSSSVESFNDGSLALSDDAEKESKSRSHALYETINSEADSNLSTVGDDTSYLRDARSLPPVFVAADSDLQ
ncbi:LAMI_0E10682g1_1 [Lachancea mirantina]|uniref:LAMI_0E10682g1_1 n=1 Tax=Lachancea mirantina TaxID=1230905 RepID=A0A1G4JPI3_9SACH|nr:LAMI_0E10682g1_1 [Lachancea mirantina]